MANKKTTTKKSKKSDVKNEVKNTTINLVDFEEEYKETEEQSKVVRLLNITTHHPIFQYTGVVATSMQSIGYDFIISPLLESETIQNQLNYYLLHTPIDVVRLTLLPNIEQLKVIVKWVQEWQNINPEGLFILDYPDHFIDLNTQNNQDFSFEILDLFDALHLNLLPIVDLLIIDAPQMQPLAFHENDENDEENNDDVEEVEIKNTNNSQPQMLQHEAVYALIDLGVKAVVVKGKHENTLKIADKLFTHEGLIMTQEHQRNPFVPCGLSSIFAMITCLSLAQHRNYCDAFSEASEYTQEVIKQSNIDENGLCDYQKMPNLLFWL